MKHEISGIFFHCKWCGDPLDKLIVANTDECSGNIGIPHIEYVRARKRFYDGMGFEVDGLGRIIKERKM